MSTRNQSDRRKRKRRGLLGPFVIFVAFAVLAVGVWWAQAQSQSLIAGNLVQIAAAQKGRVTVNIPLKAWVIWDETVVRSPFAGKLDKFVAEGTRIPLGTQVVQLSLDGKGSEIIISPRAGVVSYQLDGLEEILTKDVLKNINNLKLSELKPDAVQTSPAAANQGAPLFKIVNNLAEGLLLVNGPENWLQKNKLVSFSLEDQGEVFKSRVRQTVGSDTVWALIPVNPIPKQMLNKRETPIYIVEKTVSGILVDKESIVTKGAENGLFINNKGKVQWRPVKILGENKKVCIEGIDEGTLIVQNPSVVKEGQELK